VGDVADRLAEVGEAAAPYDVVLLDVDNGPEAITLEANEHLYTQRGLARAFRALAPGGVLAVWSANDDPRFADRLRRAGFRTSIHRVSERHGGKGGRHTIFVAARPRGG
jgi:spermidine synthase